MQLNNALSASSVSPFCLTSHLLAGKVVVSQRLDLTILMEVFSNGNDSGILPLWTFVTFELSLISPFLLPPFLPPNSSIFSQVPSSEWNRGESPAAGICKGSLVSLKHQVHFREAFSGSSSSCIPSHSYAGPPLPEKTTALLLFPPCPAFSAREES